MTPTIMMREAAEFHSGFLNTGSITLFMENESGDRRMAISKNPTPSEYGQFVSYMSLLFWWKRVTKYCVVFESFTSKMTVEDMKNFSPGDIVKNSDVSEAVVVVEIDRDEDEKKVAFSAIDGDKVSVLTKVESGLSGAVLIGAADDIFEYVAGLEDRMSGDPDFEEKCSAECVKQFGADRSTMSARVGSDTYMSASEFMDRQKKALN